ncbi:GIY-YIG nuclease family protein [Vibrio sp. OCN044]|uniref:GIY-YIG nuclease family protein n=1 Tax=Vibrio tetraodonis subsp. pristinus TaxID=2695891 RepID=A0A6L8LZ77_9VIBR|nr:GIY-YIG nuclease family protein [Vibrio tetraodonis]MYM58512.1 GIY-YIG nuclease family protein [Vibrio tetraodonis subsp. pristinus]
MHKRKGVITIYVLQLETGKYYVGQSKNARSRIDEHFLGNGSIWTQNYRPIRVIKEIELETHNWRVALEAEKQLTLNLMKIFGWQNVRGAAWTKLELQAIPRELLRS